jgi:FRG domain
MDSITSVARLVDYAATHCSAGLFLFRGQKSNKKLLPKIGRDPFLSDQFLKRERSLLRDFQIRSNPYLDSSRRDDWDWLAIAQHNGMATRLLDWTDNPLAALWFAVREDREKGMDGILWVFRPPEEDIVADQNKLNPFKNKRTTVFRPKHLIRTIAAQGGWFTVHKYVNKEKRFVPFEKIAAYKEHRYSLRIPRDKFWSLRFELDRIGVNDASMCPDLRGLCGYLNWVHLPKLSVPRFPRIDDKGGTPRYLQGQKAS